jgi:hypothetical protein
VLLIELHHLGVQLLRVLLVLLAQLADLRRQLSLLDHRLSLRDELELLKGGQGQPDEDREDDDRHAVGADGMNDWRCLKVLVQEQQEVGKGLFDPGLPQVVDGREEISEALEKVAQLDFSSGGRLGNRIVATLGEWMAASDPRRAHPPSAQPAIPLHRLVGVVGAGRVVAA